MKKALIFVLSLIVSTQIFAGIGQIDTAFTSIQDEYSSKVEYMTERGLGPVEGKIVAVITNNIDLEIENVKSLIKEFEYDQSVEAQSRILKALKNLENLVKEL